ncbi:MAG TPA: hypothetical protein V6C97_16905 [Oculatellaceae cyanobacterium]
MDVIVEGKITPDEPMFEVIETVVELKNFPHLVLRISDQESDLEGRIAFSHGGYILGGKINNSECYGYPAIHKLLSVKDGNYAVLDPGPQQISDINQTLWIMSERVMQSLPNLPESPVELFDHTSDHDEQRAANAELAASAVFTGLAFGKQEAEAEEPPPKATIGSVTNPARAFNKGFWYFIQWVCVVLFCLCVALGVANLWKLHRDMTTSPQKTLAPTTSNKKAVHSPGNR